MTAFLWNLLLALVWTALTGRVTATNFLVGLVLGYVVLVVTRRLVDSSTYVAKVPRALSLFFFFVWELVLSTLRVAYDVVTPRHHMRPAIVRIPLRAESDAAITMLANLISLTPGTLSLDVSSDRTALYVHVMYLDVENVDAFRQRIKDAYERRVLELLE